MLRQQCTAEESLSRRISRSTAGQRAGLAQGNDWGSQHGLFGMAPDFRCSAGGLNEHKRRPRNRCRQCMGSAGCQIRLLAARSIAYPSSFAAPGLVDAPVPATRGDTELTTFNLRVAGTSKLCKGIYGIPISDANYNDTCCCGGQFVRRPRDPDRRRAADWPRGAHRRISSTPVPTPATA